MIILLAQGYKQAVAVVEQIVKSRYVAINIVSDATTYPMVPITSDMIAITHFPCGSKRIYGNGVYSIATVWELELIHEDPIKIITEGIIP